MATMKIKKGDMVKVIAGKDKDKEGKVISVNKKDNTVLVEGVNMVTKHAVPPIKLETGSARKTPFTPSPAIWGKSSVSGTTITAFRNREKKIACFAFPSPVKTVCPANCKDIKQNPKK